LHERHTILIITKP